MKSAVATTQGKYLFTVDATGARVVLWTGDNIGMGDAQPASRQ